jgi:hypothetical protein
VEFVVALFAVQGVVAVIALQEIGPLLPVEIVRAVST